MQTITLSVVSISIAILGGLFKRIDYKNIDILRSSERRYRNIFESIQDICFRADMDGRIQMISPAIHKELKYDQIDMIGRPFTFICVEESEGHEIFRRLSKSGIVQEYELQVMGGDGKTRYMSFNAHYVFNNSGEPIAIDGCARNTTERKEAEDEIVQRLTYEKTVSAISTLFLSLS